MSLTKRQIEEARRLAQEEHDRHVEPVDMDQLKQDMLKSIGESLGMPFVFEADIEAQEMGFVNDEVRKINEELGFIEPRKD